MRMIVFLEFSIKPCKGIGNLKKTLKRLFEKTLFLLQPPIFTGNVKESPFLGMSTRRTDPPINDPISIGVKTGPSGRFVRGPNYGQIQKDGA